MRRSILINAVRLYVAIFSLAIYCQNVKSDNGEFRPKIVVLSLQDGCNIDAVVTSLLNITKNRDIQGLILKVNHTGGSVPEMSCVHDALCEVSKIVPTVAVVQGYALSCAYFAISPAKHIISSSLSEVGNLGLYLKLVKHRNIRVRAQNYEADQEIDYITTDKFMCIENSDSPDLSQEQRDYLESSLKKQHAIMLSLIAKHRAIDVSTLKNSEGVVFNPQEAYAIGLIDGVGTMLMAEEIITKELLLRQQANIVEQESNIKEQDGN